MAARFEHSGGRIFNAARRSTARCSASHTEPMSASQPPPDLPEAPFSFPRQISGLIVHTQYETRTGFFIHHFRLQMMRSR
jgi:hypothetical protein